MARQYRAGTKVSKPSTDTKADRLASIVDQVDRDVRRRIVQASEARDAFAQTVAERGVASAVQWADDAIVAEEIGTLAEMVFRVQTNLDGTTLVQALREVLAHVERSLIHDSLHTASTSPLSNGAAAAKATAYARFHEFFTSCADAIDAATNA